MQIATNHFGHFILTAELLPLISKAEAPRIVNVASSAQKFAPRAEKFLADINAKKKYSPWPQYGVTKLCNMLFTYELVLRLKSKYPKIIVGGQKAPRNLSAPHKTQSHLSSPLRPCPVALPLSVSGTDACVHSCSGDPPRIHGHKSPEFGQHWLFEAHHERAVCHAWRKRSHVASLRIMRR